MSKPRKQDGVVYSRKDGKILWIRYRDRNGKPCRETGFSVRGAFSSRAHFTPSKSSCARKKASAQAPRFPTSRRSRADCDITPVAHKKSPLVRSGLFSIG